MKIKTKKATEFKIEKNIPIPAKYWGRTGKTGSKYPFLEMKPGDSFYADTKQTSLYNVAWLFKKKQVKAGVKKWEFACAKEGTGARLWRTK